MNVWIKSESPIRIGVTTPRSLCMSEPLTISLNAPPHLPDSNQQPTAFIRPLCKSTLAPDEVHQPIEPNRTMSFAIICYFYCSHNKHSTEPGFLSPKSCPSISQTGLVHPTCTGNAFVAWIWTQLSFSLQKDSISQHLSPSTLYFQGGNSSKSSPSPKTDKLTKREGKSRTQWVINRTQVRCEKGGKTDKGRE